VSHVHALINGQKLKKKGKCGRHFQNMSLKHGYANPLAVLNMRVMDHCPPHFEKITFKVLGFQFKPITDWIHENTDGRFWTSTSVPNMTVAFENHSEASYFALMLPTFNVEQAM
jgi:hypothetical protein